MPISSRNPFIDDPVRDAEDGELVRRAQQGDRAAIERLIERHQPWIYNIVLKMTYDPDDAADATQELLIKLLTKLSTFEGRSAFRTWFYRIVVNHVLTMRRRKAEEYELTFSGYAEGLERSGDADPPDPNHVPVELQLLVDEARIGCTSGMLLCLDREQRLTYILGEILGVTDAIGADLLDVSRANFRQKLARARRDLHNFLDGQCGLVNAANPCRCARKMQGFIRVGYLDPGRLLFARERIIAVKQVAPRVHEALDSLDAACAAVFREHPFSDGPDLVASLRALLERPDVKSIVEER